MTIETFNSLVKNFGDQNYDEADRWKSIKYLSVEGQMEPIDFEYRFLCNDAYFINDDSYGTGFLFLETPYVEFEPINKVKDKTKRILTFIGLESINAITFNTTSVEAVNNTITLGGAN